MLARDYGCVGSKESFIGAWGTKYAVQKLGCIGNDRDGAVTISDTFGYVQVGALQRVHQNKFRPGLSVPTTYSCTFLHSSTV